MPAPVINKPPYFGSPLATTLVIQISLTPQAWNYKLPSINDDNGFPVTLTADFGSASFLYLNDKNSINIDDISVGGSSNIKAG